MIKSLTLHDCVSWPLGKPTSSKTDEFSEKFHFQSKNLCCKIWTFKLGYLTMKLIQRGPVRHPFKKFAT